MKEKRIYRGTDFLKKVCDKKLLDYQLSKRLEKKTKLSEAIRETVLNTSVYSDDSFDKLIRDVFGTRRAVKSTLELVLKFCELPFDKKYYTIFDEKIICNQIISYTKSILAKRYKEKFNSESFVDRDITLNDYKSFLYSNKTATVLRGKGGCGKSSFVCNLANLEEDNQLVILEDCYNINLHGAIEEYLKSQIFPDLEGSFLEILNDLIQYMPKLKIIIIFDALNEYENKVQLLNYISDFINSINQPQIKVLVTCRIPLWDNLLELSFKVPIHRVYHSKSPKSYILIEPFSEDELEKVFDKYKDIYLIKNNFSDLSQQVKRFISHPLLLRLTAEVYQENYIPKKLVLQAVFEKYIFQSLRKFIDVNSTEKPLYDLVYETKEFKVLKEAIELMYKHAEYELKVILLQDSNVRDYVSENIHSPLVNLIDEGIFNEKREELKEMIEKIAINHEMIFEYLLSELIIGQVSVPDVLNYLKIARERNFPPLQGAVEFALAFSISKRKIKIDFLEKIIELSSLDSRQFLCNVIQILYTSGYHEITMDIVKRLSRSKYSESKLLSIQVAYQLGFDDLMIDIILNCRDSATRDVASLFLYHRWNKSRMENKLDEGYVLLEKLLSHLDILQSKDLIPVIVSFALHICIHIIDDPGSVMPMFKILGGFFNKKTWLKKVFGNEKIKEIIIKVVAKAAKGPLLQKNIINKVFENNNYLRALMDVPNFTLLNSLIPYKKEYIEIIKTPHSTITFCSRTILMRHIYLTPESHLEFFNSIFLVDEKLPLPVKVNMLHSVIYGLIIREILELPEVDNTISTHSMSKHLLSLWVINNNLSLDEYNQQYGKYMSQEDCDWMIHYCLFGILYLESSKLQKEGKTESLTSLNTFFHEPKAAALIVSVLEKLAYQGFYQYALFTLLDSEIKNFWLKYNSDGGIQALSNIRLIYQDELDKILQSDLELLYRIKNKSGLPNRKVIMEMCFDLWLIIATAVDPTIMKLAGMFAFELSFSKSETDYVERAIKSLLTFLIDKDHLDIFITQLGLAHDSKWDYFDALSISKDILLVKPEIHKKYKIKAEEFIDRCGRGKIFSK